jgi:hypothetical protein
MQITEPILAQSIETTSNGLVIQIGDQKYSIPWDKCSPRLANASETERLFAELSPGGYGIHWPLIDEDLSVGGLIRKA